MCPLLLYTNRSHLLARIFRGNADVPAELKGKEASSILTPIYSVNEKVGFALHGKTIIVSRSKKLSIR
jgi:hypothetical protein